MASFAAVTTLSGADLRELRIQLVVEDEDVVGDRRQVGEVGEARKRGRILDVDRRFSGAMELDFD